ncbi:recombination protein NinG [Pseudomonas abietaniphila]
MRPKRCRVAGCGATYTPTRSFQKWCSPDCAVVLAREAQEKQRKSIAQRERREIKVRKEKLKSRAELLKDTQQAFNAWVRERDALLTCVSCGRHHNGQWHAGHYRTVSAHPAIRFEPLNVWKQCAPCNTHKSGDLLNYRAELIRRIGEEMVLWLEGPHEPKKYTIDELKALTAHYRELTRELKRTQA